jgi:hypothetical protein
MSRSISADSIPSNPFLDISSTSMDVLWYNAGAISDNSVLPR